MQILGQRDNRWKDEKLGFGNTTIGDYGCTITALAMLAGLLPNEVNDRLKNVKGYAGDNKNLIIWSKIKEAIPWLEFEWRGYSYDNNKVSSAIEKNGGCLVEVDFDGTPNTNDKHWILLIGNQKIYDPWTGREASTNKYKIYTGYAIINKTEIPPSQNGDKVEIDSKTFEELVKKSTYYDSFYAKGWETPEDVEALLRQMRTSLDEAKLSEKEAREKSQLLADTILTHFEILANPNHLDTAISWEEIENKAKLFGTTEQKLEDITIDYDKDKKAWAKKEQELKAQIAFLEEELKIAKNIQNDEIRKLITEKIKSTIRWLKNIIKES